MMSLLQQDESANPKRAWANIYDEEYRGDCEKLLMRFCYKDNEPQRRSELYRRGSRKMLELIPVAVHEVNHCSRTQSRNLRR